MKHYLFTLWKLWLYWILLFMVCRGLFILFYLPTIQELDLSVGSVMATFYHAFRIDVATACCLVIPALIVLLFGELFKSKLIFQVNFWLSMVLTAWSVMIYEGEIGLYKEWKTKLNYKAVSALATPGDVLVSVSLVDLFLFLFVLAVFLIAAYWVFKKWVLKPIYPKQSVWWQNLIAFPLLGALCFVGIRGLDRFPLAVSQATFSHVQFLNDVATNSVYFLAYNASKSTARKSEKKYTTMPDAQAEKIVRDLHQSNGVPSAHVLDLKNHPKPNIVIFVLESWQYDVAKPHTPFMPFFSTLCDQGLFFNQFYANGSHSDQGIACIFSGFPTLSAVSLPRSQDKYALAASLLKPFQERGYDNYFQYGGQLYFGGIQSYIYHVGFEKVYDVKDFDSSIKRGSVGVHDHDNLRVYADQLSKLKEPFFSSCYTISTHAPYDNPGIQKYNNLPESKYLNAMYYSDGAMRDFFAKAEKEPWFKNTLFIMIPDHGHPTHIHNVYRSFDICRLPMLWVGPVLKKNYAGKEISTLCSQVDIAKTLLHQFGIPAGDFIWSKDIFDSEVQRFALRTVDDGFGFKTPQGEYYYNIDEKRYYYNTFPKALQDSMGKVGRAYMQVHVQKFSRQ